MLEIDGSRHSGSGSIVRLAAAYAALTSTPVHVVNARARREPKPGLRRQHCMALHATRDLVGGTLEGAVVDSREFMLRPGDEVPEGQYCWDIGSAGSTTALALALLPLLASRGRGVEVELRGGVFQDFAPSAFHLQRVVGPLVRRMGVEVDFEVERAGYVPAGGGILRVTVGPSASRLQPLRLEQPGEVWRVRGIALASHLADRDVSGRMAEAARKQLAQAGIDADIHVVEDTAAAQPGAAFAVFAETTGDTILGADGAGAPRRPNGSASAPPTSFSTTSVAVRPSTGTPPTSCSSSPRWPRARPCTGHRPSPATWSQPPGSPTSSSGPTSLSLTTAPSP